LKIQRETTEKLAEKVHGGRKERVGGADTRFPVKNLRDGELWRSEKSSMRCNRKREVERKESDGATILKIEDRLRSIFWPGRDNSYMH